MIRAALALALALAGLCAAEGRAQGDEVFVLDNGMVLRGTALEESDAQVVVRLSGFAEDARVTVETARIVNRYAGRSVSRVGTAGPGRRPATDVPVMEDLGVPPLGAGPWTRPELAPEPLEEPGVRHEGFFERLHRVVLMAMPSDAVSRSVLSGLFFIALLALLGLGSRLLEIEGLSIVRATTLAAGLGVMVLGDTLYNDLLLRADRALWVVPTQCLAWLALSLWLLRCDFGKAVLLLAFLLFSLGVVAFTAGAVLVAF